jgi:hypothetical protein
MARNRPIAQTNIRSKQMTVAVENHASIRAHTGLGIASFITGMFCLVLTVGLFGYAGVMTNAGKATPELNMILGFGIFFAWFVSTVRRRRSSRCSASSSASASCCSA